MSVKKVSRKATVASVGEISLPTISYIATGGTIAMQRAENGGGPVPAIEGQDLINRGSELSQYASVEVENFSNSPSVNFGPEDWVALYHQVSLALARPEIAAVIISHGTDSMEETGYFLDLTLNSSKPVILFGAQRSASDDDNDGPGNLLSALLVATSVDTRDRGVMIVMNRQISAARDVSKTHTTDIDSFQPVDSEFLGYVQDAEVVFSRSPTKRQHITLNTGRLSDNRLCRVDIVSMYPGADDSLLNAAIAVGAKGIVIQALGAGNVNPALFDAIRQAVDSGVKVVIASRVPRGSTQPIYGYPGGGQTLVQAGAVFSGDLSPQKARVLLMLALQENVATKPHKSLEQIFD